MAVNRALDRWEPRWWDGEVVQPMSRSRLAVSHEGVQLSTYRKRSDGAEREGEKGAPTIHGVFLDSWTVGQWGR